MLDKIEHVLEQYVRPQLSEHYGDVEVLSLEDGNLKIKLLGQCSNCPSAKFTVEDVIESEIKKHVQEVRKVTLIESVSDDLLEMAKKILSHKKES
ncbi:NifU family protein [Sedimentibacter sp. MB31-C6]|uniref:NifU family protein n=1 Tax=Sedimentibacter sp. MB31-C6 TaxID=3109366 RepID=UPI002DDD2448|nr:NifU family protein [Sedimentibacter sp. MB36-C1]WSI04882.1 NifU family protein [Sedimentibacter sp. MB36-C1]